MITLSDNLLDIVTDITNRSKAQTIFLFSLLQDFDKLVKLEERIRNNHINYCPGDIAECELILNMPNGGKFGRYFNFFDRYAEITNIKNGIPIS